MKRIIRVLLVFVILFVQSTSFAREMREYSLKQKVEDSDLIFVGNVLAIKRPKHMTEGVNAFAVVKVTESIKGAQKGKKLKFVVQGVIAESNSACCLVGSKYLFFARQGAQVLTIDGDSIGGMIDLQEDFVSPTNGMFSTYPVVSGVVSGWRDKNVGVANSLTAVRKEICEVILQSELKGLE